jgi:ubiquinone/menaquinone biosynthesis C-methylase UbiE
VSFDLLAPHYYWLEEIVFARRLQDARMAFVRRLSEPRRVLVVGEGDGRFLGEFIRLYPSAEIDCIDASPRMLALAQQRTRGGLIRFLNVALEEAELPEKAYDLLVTHFFLDCFAEKTLPGIVRKLAAAAAGEAEWLVAEFQQPTRGWLRFPRRWLISLMYACFRLVAGIEGRRLVDYRQLLRANGFELVGSEGLPDEMIRSEHWRRSLFADLSPTTGET